MFSERKLKFLHPKEKVQMVSGIQSVHDYIIAWPFLVTDSLYVISLTRRINFWNLNTFKLPKVQPFTATDRFINRLRRTELKWVWNFPSLAVCSSCCSWFCFPSWPIMVTMLLHHTNAKEPQTPLPMSLKRCPWTMSAFIIQVRARDVKFNFLQYLRYKALLRDFSSILCNHLKCCRLQLYVRLLTGHEMGGGRKE